MANSPESGLRVGPYRLVRELGRGGQAIVHLAEDTRIARTVALKLLPALGPGAAEALARFRREAEVTARLEHPAIAAVLEADLDGTTPFIAMRYVPGETLARRLSRARDESRPPPDVAELRELARYVERAARALHLAHEAGVVHRDIKPANLMVTPEGEPVILDFGLARQDDVEGQGLSVSGELSGTPAYMSPEQLSGRVRPDRRADVWALGVALYEAATRVHPFAAATRESLFHAVLSEEAPDARRANPAIDRDLATVLETALAKERDRRYQSAHELAEDLRRWREHEPLRARPLAAHQRLARWARRKPALAGSAAAIVLLALGSSALLAYGLGAQGRAEAENGLRRQADKARDEADQQRAAAEAARAELARIEADRTLGAALDELNVQLGTLIFGLRMESAGAALLPRYLALLRAHGFDLEGREPLPALCERGAALAARNPELGGVLLDALRNVGQLATRTAVESADALRPRVLGLIECSAGPGWPELDAARPLWKAGDPGALEPLLAPEALAERTNEQLFDLAGLLIESPGHLAEARALLARILARDPGSFRLHFLVAALGFMAIGQAGEQAAETAREEAPALVHHLQVCVALRPRSGFVRAMLANAQAMAGEYTVSLATLDEACALEPDNALVWLFRARYFSYSPYSAPGIAACRRALELDPTLDAARELQAELEARQPR